MRSSVIRVMVLRLNKAYQLNHHGQRHSHCVFEHCTEPVIISHLTEKKKYSMCPKHARHAMVYEIKEYTKWICMAMEVIAKLQKDRRMPYRGLIAQLHEE
jgi:hypothetical protein